MTREDIIQLAKKSKWGASGSKWLVTDAGVERFAALVAEAERAAERERMTVNSIHSCHDECDRPGCVAVRKAVEAEREACAEICDAEATIEGIAQRCAAAIRARGSK